MSDRPWKAVKSEGISEREKYDLPALPPAKNKDVPLDQLEGETDDLKCPHCGTPTDDELEPGRAIFEKSWPQWDCGQHVELVVQCPGCENLIVVDASY